MTKREIKTAPVYRTAEIRASGDSSSGTYSLSFSSEEPVERWMYIGDDYRRGLEVLSHEKEAVDLSFFASGRAPLLDAYHFYGKQVGVVTSAELAEGRLRGEVKVSRSEAGAELARDIEDGIRTNISIGYEIEEIEIKEGKSRDDPDTFLVTRWRPIEATAVSIPADTTVGFGRSDKDTRTVKTIVRSEAPTKMPDVIDTPETSASETPIESAEDFGQSREDALAAEQSRTENILELGRKFNLQEMAHKAVRKGMSVEAFRGAVLESLPEGTPMADYSVDMSAKERKQYSILKGLRHQLALKEGNVSFARQLEGLEQEVSEDLAKKCDKEARGLMVPHDMLTGSRILGVTTGSGGNSLNAEAELVGTDHRGDMFIELLRPISVLGQAGVRMLSGLQGNLEIPRASGGSAAAWLANEDDQAAESDATFDQVALSPKDLACYTSVSRRLLQQSDPSVDNFVRQDLREAVAEGMDIAGINGGGSSGVPQGIIGATGVGTESLATLSYAGVVAMLTDILRANAGRYGGKAWVTNATGFFRFATTLRETGTGNYLLDQMSTPEGQAVMGRVLGYPFLVSENVPGNLGTGTDESAVIFGAWPQMMFGFWGGVDLVIDPYTESRRGRMRLTIFQTADIAVRQPAAFTRAIDLAATAG